MILPHHAINPPETLINKGFGVILGVWQAYGKRMANVWQILRLWRVNGARGGPFKGSAIYR